MKKILYFAMSVLLLLANASLFSLPSFAEEPNLIPNASVETETVSKPANWATNSWGTNSAAFEYSAQGNTGGRSVSVSVTNYTNGDAKWYADQVAVTAGQTYVYTDYSKSDVATELDAAYTLSSGAMNFGYLKTILASADWQLNSSTFTVPAGVVSVSIYHILHSNGSLQTDDFSLRLQSSTTPTEPNTPTTPTTPTGNLFANNSFETANGTDPAAWARGGWGANTATFNYVSTNAHSGTRSASITLTNVTSGDAKWYASPVAVTGGTTYTYHDYYQSTVGTRVVAAMTNASGTESFTELAAAPSASAWTLYTAPIVIPTGILSLTIYHLIDQAGTLTIDDVSLVAGTTSTPMPPSTNPIANPSFETANGTAPANWQGEKWGSNTATFTYPKTGAHTGTKSSKVTISNYVSGDAKWSFTPITTLTPGSQYTLSAWYKTNTQAHVVASYTDTAGAQQYITLPNPLPGANATTVWQQYSSTLDVPSDAASVSVYFLISSNGWLQTDDFNMAVYTPTGFNAPMISLTFDDGWSSIYSNGLPLLQKYGLVSTQYLVSGKLNTTSYMTTTQAKAFLTAGHEIGSHTVTHPDLTKSTATQLTNELRNSQTTIRELFGVDTAQTFASPTGTYNIKTLTAIKQYYQSHRSTDVGYNTKDNFNPYNIVVQNITSSTTPTEVAGWVSKAKAENAWLVIVYHEVTTASNADEYSVTASNLELELSNIKASGVEVKTISQALAAIKTQL